MPDNKQKKGKPDRRRVSKTDHSEIRYLQKQYSNLQPMEILVAVRAAGPMRRNIVRFIQRQYFPEEEEE
jgi:hypothetical protein